MAISYDYSDLLNEFEQDFFEGLIDLNGDVWIVRSEKAISGSYKPIVDYYYVSTFDAFNKDNPDSFKVIKVSTKKVLAEMKEKHRLF